MAPSGGVGQQLQQQNMQLQAMNHDLRSRLGHAEMTMQKMAAQLSGERERYVNLEAEFQGTTEEMQLEVCSATTHRCELTPLDAHCTTYVPTFQRFENLCFDELTIQHHIQSKQN